MLETLIRHARDLRGDDAEVNPEYERALVELVVNVAYETDPGLRELFPDLGAGDLSDLVTEAIRPPVEPEPRQPVVRCAYCADEIGIIHYSDGDRWQPTPAFGDDFCVDRWLKDFPPTANQMDAAVSGQFRHSPTAEAGAA